MPRRPRRATGGLAYHVLNRRVSRLPLFEQPADYAAFEKVLQEAVAQSGIRIAAYCLMPNHWHLLLWPREDGELSEVLRWITVTHTQRWHAHRKTAGTGPVYQGRFKSFPVQTDAHFLTVARYVERNAFRAKLVDRAEDWPWSSLPVWLQPPQLPWLDAGPAPRHPGWLEYVQMPHREAERAALRRSVERGAPYGSPAWVKRAAAQLGLESSLRPPGRPRKSASPTDDEGGLLLRQQP